MKFKLTKTERRWVLYDAGNSAFTLLATTIMPVYFNSLAGSQGISEVDYLAYWGYATTASTIIVACMAPLLGTVSDYPGWKKKLFSVSLLIGAIGCLGLGVMQSWIWFLLLFVLAKSAYSINLVFYDSMLTDVTTPARMSRISANGYAIGYIGSCIPFILALLLVLFYDSIGLSIQSAMMLAFLLVSVWWVTLTIPLWRTYRQKYAATPSSQPLTDSFARLSKIFSELKQNKKALFFLASFFFFIDGVYTIIDMATAYGTALGLNTESLLLALLVTQIVAFPAALIFGKLSSKFSSAKLILICIGAYFLIVLYAMGLRFEYQFWILAVCVGAFQGGVQSLSRSYFASIIPPEKSGEYFGIYDICGKGASILGTFSVSVVTQITNNASLGVGILAVMFVIGGGLFLQTMRQVPAADAPDLETAG